MVRICDLHPWDMSSNLIFSIPFVRVANSHEDGLQDSLSVWYNHNGYVLSLRDGIATADGLIGVKVGEIVFFKTMDQQLMIFGLVLNLNYNTVNIVVLGDERYVSEGQVVSASNKLFGVPVGWYCLGKVLNASGMVISENFLLTNSSENFSIVERKAPGIKFRQPVNEPIITGLKVIDALIPIGRGQRELIIGDRQTGKSTLGIDSILNQKNYFEIYPEKLNFKDVTQINDQNKNICIYVAIGQKRSTVAKLVNTLQNKGALRYTSIFAATASDPASMQYIIPYSACTLAEYFVRFGLSTLIIYDDLSKHANAYRQISLLLRRPPGREAYPGDVFYLHSRLLERSFKLSSLYGGGSITALPIIETQAGDVSAYIPTNVISITDGQIFLETELFYKGIRPAVNPGLSVSRVGSAAQEKVMKKIAGSLKLELAQYREVLAFSKFGSSLDETTKRLLNRGELLTEILKQAQNVPLVLEQQIITMFPVIRGFFDNIGIGYIYELQFEFLQFIKSIIFTNYRLIHKKVDFLFLLISKLIYIFLNLKNKNNTNDYKL